MSCNPTLSLNSIQSETGRTIKDINDILKGFEILETMDDGTIHYDVKQLHSVRFDYFEVHGITIYPTGHIDAVVDKNCDLLEDIQDNLDEFHVYKLTEIA